MLARAMFTEGFNTEQALVIIDAFTAFGGFVAIVMAVSRLVGRDSPGAGRIYLAGALFAIGVSQLLTFRDAPDPNSSATRIIRAADLSAIYACGVFFYFYVRQLVNANFQAGWREVLQFAPLAFIPAWNALAYNYPETLARHDIDRQFTSFSFLFFGFLAAARLWGLIRPDGTNALAIAGRDKVASLFVVLGTAFLGAAFSMLGAIFQSRLSLAVSLGFVSLAIIQLFLIDLIFPELAGYLNYRSRKRRNKRSYLQAPDLNLLERQFEYLMQQERIYARPGLTLAQTAQELEATDEELSAFLRQRYQTNFGDYLHAQRIRAARRLLVEEPQKRVADIAREVGYPTTGEFHRIFTEETAHTPRMYRRGRL